MKKKKPRNKHTQTKKEKHKFKKSDQNQTKVTQSIKTKTTFKPDIISQSTNTYEEKQRNSINKTKMKHACREENQKTNFD